MDLRNVVQCITASSGNVAAATATATIPAVVGKTSYLSGLMISGAGATAGAVVNPTITGLAGGTMTLTYCAATGPTVANTPLVIDFDPDLPASAVNTAITISCPSLGAGNTNNTVVAWGYQI